MKEYGVWSAAAGGFIAHQMYSTAEAERERVRLIEQGEEADDLKVIEICPDHEEQPRNGCEECEAG